MAFELLANSVAAPLGIMKLNPPTRALVEPANQGLVVENRHHPETPVSSLMMRRDMAVAANPFRLCDSGSSNINAPRATGPTSMTLS